MPNRGYMYLYEWIPMIEAEQIHDFWKANSLKKEKGWQITENSCDGFQATTVFVIFWTFLNSREISQLAIIFFKWVETCWNHQLEDVSKKLAA